MYFIFIKGFAVQSKKFPNARPYNPEKLFSVRGVKAKNNDNIPASSMTVDFFAVGGGSPAHTAFSL